MPYKKKTYPRKKKRTYRKKNTSMMTKSPSYPIGKSFKFKTRYVEINGSLDASSTTASTLVYSMNALYDPNITSVGHQPIGFDQIMPMYDHYTVIGSRARVCFTNTDTVQSQLVYLQLKDNATVSTITNDILENGNVKWGMLGSSTSGKAVGNYTITCSPSKFFGQKVMGEDKYQGTISSNPADQVYLHIHALGTSGANPTSVRFTIQIDYIAVLTEPKQLVGS